MDKLLKKLVFLHLLPGALNTYSDPHVSCRTLGKLCKVGIFATMAELVSRCKTLGELLERAINFYNLISSDIPIRLSRSRGNAVFSFTMHKP